MIFLDTPILSVAYRIKYKNDKAKPIEVFMLQQRVAEHKPIQIPGIVVQEFLSGLKEESPLLNIHAPLKRFGAKTKVCNAYSN